MCNNNSCQCLSKRPPKPPPRPKLYYDDVSPKARSVLMLIKKLNLDVEMKFVNTLRSEHMTQEYRDINPGNTVPTLVDRGLVLFSSPAIQIYLVCKYGKDSDLYPSTCDDQMNVLNLLFFDISVLYRRHGTCVVEMIRQGGADSVKEFYGERVLDCYKALEELLTKHCFMALEQMTIADYAVIGTITGLDILYPLEEHAKDLPNLQRWYKDMSCLPEFEEMLPGIERERSAIRKFTDRRELQSLISQDLYGNEADDDEAEGEVEDEDENDAVDQDDLDVERVCDCDYDPDYEPPKEMIYDTMTASQQYLELQQRMEQKQQQKMQQQQHAPDCCCCVCEKEKEKQLQNMRNHEVRPSQALPRLSQGARRSLQPAPPPQQDEEHDESCCCCVCKKEQQPKTPPPPPPQHDSDCCCCECEKDKLKEQQKFEVRPTRASPRLSQGARRPSQAPPPTPQQDDEHDENCCCCVCKKENQQKRLQQQKQTQQRQQQRSKPRQQQQYDSQDHFDELEDFDKRPIQSLRRTALDPIRISQIEEMQAKGLPQRSTQAQQPRLSQARSVAPQPRASLAQQQPRALLQPQPRSSLAPQPRQSQAPMPRQSQTSRPRPQYKQPPTDYPASQYDPCTALYAECLEDVNSNTKSKLSLLSDECCCCRCNSAVNTVDRVFTPKKAAPPPQRLPSKSALQQKQQYYNAAAYGSNNCDPCRVCENENARKVAAFERALASSCLQTDKSCANNDNCLCSGIAANYAQQNDMQQQYSECNQQQGGSKYNTDDPEDDCCCCACEANRENLKHYKGDDAAQYAAVTPSRTDTSPRMQKCKTSAPKQMQSRTKQQLTYSQESFERAKANSCLAKNLGCGGNEDCPCGEIAARYEAKLQAQREDWLTRAAPDEDDYEASAGGPCACCDCSAKAGNMLPKDNLSSDQDPHEDDDLDDDDEELLQNVSQKSVISKRTVVRKSAMSVKKANPIEDDEGDDEEEMVAPRRSTIKRPLLKKPAKSAGTSVSKSGSKNTALSQQQLSDIMAPKRLPASTSKSKGSKIMDKEKEKLRKGRTTTIAKGSRESSVSAKSTDIKIKPRSSSVPRSAEKRQSCDTCCADPKCEQCWQEGSSRRSQTPTAKRKSIITTAKASQKTKTKSANPCCKCHAVDAYYDDGNCHCDLQLPSHNVPLQKRRSAGEVCGTQSGSDSDSDGAKKEPAKKKICRPPENLNVRVPCGTCHCFNRICLCTHCIQAMQNRLDESFYWYLDQPNSNFPQNFPETKDCQAACPLSSGKEPPKQIITPQTLRATIQSKLQSKLEETTAKPVADSPQLRHPNNLAEFLTLIRSDISLYLKATERKPSLMLQQRKRSQCSLMAELMRCQGGGAHGGSFVPLMQHGDEVEMQRMRFEVARLLNTMNELLQQPTSLQGSEASLKSYRHYPSMKDLLKQRASLHSAATPVPSITNASPTKKKSCSHISSSPKKRRTGKRKAIRYKLRNSISNVPIAATRTFIARQLMANAAAKQMQPQVPTLIITPSIADLLTGVSQLLHKLNGTPLNEERRHNSLQYSRHYSSAPKRVASGRDVSKRSQVEFNLPRSVRINLDSTRESRASTVTPRRSLTRQESFRKSRAESASPRPSLTRQHTSRQSRNRDLPAYTITPGPVGEIWADIDSTTGVDLRHGSSTPIWTARQNKKFCPNCTKKIRSARSLSHPLPAKYLPISANAQEFRCGKCLAQSPQEGANFLQHLNAQHLAPIEQLKTGRNLEDVAVLTSLSNKLNIKLAKQKLILAKKVVAKGGEPMKITTAAVTSTKSNSDVFRRLQADRKRAGTDGINKEQKTEPITSPQTSPETSPSTSPKASPKPSPKSTPKPSPKATPIPSPSPSNKSQQLTKQTETKSSQTSCTRPIQKSKDRFNPRNQRARPVGICLRANCKIPAKGVPTQHQRLQRPQNLRKNQPSKSAGPKTASQQKLQPKSKQQKSHGLGRLSSQSKAGIKQQENKKGQESNKEPKKEPSRGSSKESSKEILTKTSKSSKGSSKEISKGTSKISTKTTSKVTFKETAKEIIIKSSKASSKETPKETSKSTSRATLKDSSKVISRATLQETSKEKPKVTPKETEKVPNKTPKIQAKAIPKELLKDVPIETQKYSSKKPLIETPMEPQQESQKTIRFEMKPQEPKPSDMQLQERRKESWRAPIQYTPVRAKVDHRQRAKKKLKVPTPSIEEPMPVKSPTELQIPVSEYEEEERWQLTKIEMEAKNPITNEDEGRQNVVVLYFNPEASGESKKFQNNSNSAHLLDLVKRKSGGAVRAERAVKAEKKQLPIIENNLVVGEPRTSGSEIYMGTATVTNEESLHKAADESAHESFARIVTVEDCSDHSDVAEQISIESVKELDTENSWSSIESACNENESGNMKATLSESLSAHESSAETLTVDNRSDDSDVTYNVSMEFVRDLDTEDSWSSFVCMRNEGGENEDASSIMKVTLSESLSRSHEAEVIVSEILAETIYDLELSASEASLFNRGSRLTVGSHIESEGNLSRRLISDSSFSSAYTDDLSDSSSNDQLDLSGSDNWSRKTKASNASRLVSRRESRLSFSDEDSSSSISDSDIDWDDPDHSELSSVDGLQLSETSFSSLNEVDIPNGEELLETTALS